MSVDGYDALLVESEGGKAVEIVSEENGVLISTILRQYFMSLKVMGKWKRWSPSLRRHWAGVQQGISKENKHEFREPKPPQHPTVEAVKQGHKRSRSTASDRSDSSVNSEQDSGINGSDTEDEEFDPKAIVQKEISKERELAIARKVMRKWWRLTGLKGHPALCDPLGEEFSPSWTKSICPRVEGRIIITGSKE